MHELSVTENVLKIALRHAEQHKAARVEKVNLVVGQLSSIVDDSVQFYWDIISEKTLCAGSELSFTRIPAIFKCQDCGNEYVLAAEMMPCPKCGSLKNKILTGEEFYVESIEIITDEKVNP